MYLPVECIEIVITYLPLKQRFRIATDTCLLYIQKQCLLRLGCASITYASRKGQCDLLDMLDSIKNLKRANVASACLFLASAYGHPGVLTWWKQHHPFPAHHIKQCMTEASRNGHVAVLQWWQTELSTTARRSRSTKENTNIMNIVPKNTRRNVMMVDTAVDAMLVASVHGQCDVLEWWWQQTIVGPKTIKILHELSVFDTSMILASTHGHVCVLEWWKRYPSFATHKNLVRCVTEASRNGHIAVLQWWKENGGIFECPPDAIILATLNEHVHVLKWWKESKLPHWQEETTVHDAILAANCYSRINMLEWWKENSEQPFKRSWVVDAVRVCRGASHHVRNVGTVTMGFKRDLVLQWYMDHYPSFCSAE